MTFRSIIHQIPSLCLILLCAACTSHPSVPDDAVQSDRLPSIFPDYTDVTVPPNIAPLNFRLNGAPDDVVARFTTADGVQTTFGCGTKVLIDQDDWRDMLQRSRGKDMRVEVFGRRGGRWTAYKPFTITVAAEDIDPYISYRTIMPSYVAYEMLTINQRNVTNFEEREIYNNMIISSESDGQCINCHSYQNYGTKNMQFHMRQGHGGTMIVRDGQAVKVDLKTDSTISAGVYPAWHPTLPLIAYSTNLTGQSFHTKDHAKIEVQDSESDLILYDVEHNTVSAIEDEEGEFEVFPTWSPDGRTLYYCSASFWFDPADTTSHSGQLIKRYDEVKYDIYRKRFDPRRRTFGERELVYAASRADSIGASATFPRVSPDGRYLLFAQGRFGCFHVWHPDADLYVTDLKSGKTRKLENVNSDRAESYHAWSSNGRWILFISRRDDNNYSRLYMAYFDRQGHARKAFELPQADPDFYDFYMRSYNVPEFMREPVTVSAQTLAAAAREEPVKATFKGTRHSTSHPRRDGGASPARTDGTSGASQLRQRHATSDSAARHGEVIGPPL